METSFKILSDTAIELKFETFDFQNHQHSFSEFIQFNGVRWNVHLGLTTPDHVGVFVDCQGNSSDLWKIGAELTCKLWAKDEKRNDRVATVQALYTRRHNHFGWPRAVLISELLDGFVKDGKVTVEITIEILSTSGFPKAVLHNFEEKDETVSDIVLVVEGRKLHVGKMILACASPVFKSMFYSDFKESKAAEIPIYEVEFDEFEQFLQLIYNNHVDIYESNAESLLKLADRFDVQSVIRKCEQYLILSKVVRMDDKLRLADEYNLSELQGSCLDMITNKAELEKYVPDVDYVGESSAKALYKKLLTFSNNGNTLSQ